MRNIIGNSVDKAMTALAVMFGVLSNILTDRYRLKTPRLHPAIQVLGILIVMFMIIPGALADGGDFSITHRAADPVDYPSILPGSVIAPISNGTTPDALNLTEYGDIPTDSVASLTPDDMGLGQIVVYEYLISVSSDTSAEDSITFSYFWDCEVTNNGDFGYDEDYGVIAAFVDTSDDGNLNLDGDETVSSFFWTANENDADPLSDEIEGNFTVSGLDPDDKVVVEVWVVLDDTIPEGTGGNVATGMINNAYVTDTGDTINVGTNTIPLLQVGGFFTVDVDLLIEKHDLTGPVVIGDTISYEINVTNNGPSVANDVSVTDTLDSNTTFVSASDGYIYDAGTHTVSWALGFLNSGESKIITITVEVDETAPTTGSEDIYNYVTVTTISDDIDLTNNQDFEWTGAQVDNQPPVANDDSATTPEDTPVTIDAAANDLDVDGNLVPSSSTVTSGPTNGAVTNNGDGTFTYTPDPDYNGLDSFDYEICDTDGLCDTATVTITVTPVNDAPVAVDDNSTTPEDTPVTTPVLDNDSDLDGDTLTVDSVTQPDNGAVVINSDGTVTYTPNEDFNGEDSYTYTISDGNGGTDTATVTITVTPVNDAPVAVDDNSTTPEDTPVTTPVLDNDNAGPTNENQALTVVEVTQPANGAVDINSDGTVTYAPSSRFCGIDTFTYTISDSEGATDTATVTINVNCINQRSIQIESMDATLSSDRDDVIGNFVISDQSEEGQEDELDVQITSLNILVEHKVGKEWVEVPTVNCIYHYDELRQQVLVTPVIFGDEITIYYDCMLDQPVPEDAKQYRVITEVMIFGREDVYTYTETLNV